MIEAPYSQEAEEAAIGSVLINPNTFYAIRGFLKHDDFYFLRHSYIWQAMERLVDRNEPIDNITLQHELDAIGLLDEIGGAAFITHLIANTPTSVHGEVYGRLVERAAIRRRLMVAADEIKVLATDEQLTTEDVMQQATAKMFGAVQDKATRDKTWYESVGDYTEDMLHVWDKPDGTLGIPTGHKALDRHTLGLQKNWLIYLAARPGVGKTVLLLLWALYAAKAGYKVGFWSGEMSSHQMVERAAASLSKIPNTAIRAGNLSDYQRRQMTEAVKTLSELPIVGLWTKAGITPGDLHMKALEAQARGGLDILFIDYLGLMRGDERNVSKYHETTAISQSLKGIANSCNIPVIAGVQLSRSVENRQDKHPQLYDLRDSGALEQDADIVIGLYRDEMYNEATEWPGLIEMQMLKYRHGEPRTFYGKFDGATSTIIEGQLKGFRTA